MTKVRDIAAFLGKTESLNTTNKTLAFDSSAVTIISQEVVTTLAGAGGTVVYDSVGLLPASPNDGDRAWVTSNNRFYVADSSWHNSLLINIPPTINIANYDSVLTDSQSLTMTIQVTDSHENLDIISFNAVLSPPNITDSAIATFSRDSSVIAIAMSPDSTNDATSFTITFSANDQVNLSTSVKSFTIDKGFVLEPLSQIINLSGSTIINADSDLAGGTFSLVSGDIVSDSGGSVTATISNATFLENTQQSQTNIGSLYGATVGSQGTGYFALQQDGSFGSSHIGRVVSFGSSNSTAASRFRTGNSSGGQTITGYTTQTHSVTTTSTSASANSPHYVFGFPLKSMQYQGRAQLLVSQSYGTINPALSTGTYTFNSDGSSPATVNNILTSYQGHTIKQHNPGATASSNFDYLSLVITYWNGRYNYMEYTNTSGVTYFKCQHNRTSYFTAGKVFYPTYSNPTSREILEGQCLAVMSSSYNSGTNETTVYCGNQFGLQIRNFDDTGGTSRQFSTGSVLTPGNGGHYYAVWISKNAQAMQLINNTITNTSLDLTYNQSVQGVYMNLQRDLNFYEVTTTTTNTNYYKVQTQASPAGNGTNINLGTSSGSMYTWEKETALTVDDNTGLTAGKILQKKT